MSQNARFGLIGLGVMGSSLALNMVDHGITLKVFSISAEERQRVNDQLEVRESVASLISELEAPRVIFLMVTAGDAVDEIFAQLIPLLDAGDTVIDGGNSHYLDTERRVTQGRDAGIHFVGAGISGGEEGARYGASVMVGGSKANFTRLDPLFAAIATEAQGEPCYGWVGEGGAGHFVKAVHNGIEYGVMQLIAESYDFLVRGLGQDLPGAQAWFEAQQGGVLDSYLIDITATILRKRDGDGYLLEKVSDVAEQKGTGRWCVDAALTMGVPVPTIVAAVTERQLSNATGARVALANGLGAIEPIRGEYADDLRDALLFAVIVTFAQGLDLIRAASQENDWNTDLATAIKLWRGGCIIRAALLEDLLDAADTLAAGENLLTNENMQHQIAQCLPGARRIVGGAVSAGVPVPAMSSALSYLDSLRSGRLATHMVQAQRDCFGAHQFARTDQPGRFHVDWFEAE